MKGAKALLLVLVLMAGGPAFSQDNPNDRVDNAGETDVLTAPVAPSSETDESGTAPAPSGPVRAKTPAGSTDQRRDETAGQSPPSGGWQDRAVTPSPSEGGDPVDPQIDHRPRGGRPVDPGHPPRGGRPTPPRRYHGRHDEWRHRYYGHHGSWRFLWHFGPVIIRPPAPPVIRARSYRPRIYVRQSGSDGLGVSFANAVRDELRDRGLRVVYSSGEATLELYIVSMEIEPDDPGYNSAVSVSYIWQPGNRFITSQMVDLGSYQLDDLAGMIAEYADDLTDNYR